MRARETVIAGVAIATVALAIGRAASADDPGTPVKLEIPPGFDPPQVPKTNPITKEKVTLGERLFFEKALSLDRSIACASCHDPRLGFSDGRKTSRGIHGRTGMRNAPALLNVAYVRELFLDGRADTLEDQVFGPILNPLEMGLASVAAIESRIAEDASYRPLFLAAFHDATPKAEHAAQAIASFERTLISLTSPVDRFLAGDTAAISTEAARGWVVFRRKAGCLSCHYADAQLPVWSEMTFRSLGVGFDSVPFAQASAQADRIEAAAKSAPGEVAAIKAEPASAILGRYLVTGDRKDIGRFRNQSLRNIARTAPYMHDGSLATLRAVVDFYDKGGEPIPTKHFQIRKLGLTEEEKAQLVAFMEALNVDPSPNFDLHALENKANAVLGPLGPF